jgi:hypothetical protein
MTKALTTIGQTLGVVALAAIDRSPDLADSTKAQCKKALTNYLNAGHSLMDAEALADYPLTLPSRGRRS